MQGEWERRYSAIRRVVEEFSPDICLFQEIWVDKRLNMVETIAEGLGMSFVWGPSSNPKLWALRGSSPTVVVGNAIMSRYPISDRAQHNLPSESGGDDGRSVLYASVNAGKVVVPTFTTHLSSGPGKSRVRRRQIASLVRFVRSRSSSSFPIVLGGDFNAEPDSDEIRLLEGRKTSPIFSDLVLVDAWRYAAEGASGMTWNNANPNVANRPWHVSGRIDYVFLGEPLASGAGSVVAIRLVGDCPIGGVWPSDHAGVLVDVVE